MADSERTAEIDFWRRKKKILAVRDFVKRIILTNILDSSIKTNMNRIVKALNEIIQKEQTTVYAVAKAIGVDISSLYRALKNGGNLGAKSIDKILEHFGYEVRLIKSKAKEVKPTRSQSHKRRR